MISYKDILNNEAIKAEYAKIDKINPFPFAHGLQHINNVCAIMDELTDLLNISGEEKDALMISAVLHDVGQADGRERHGYKARKFAERLLDDELRGNSYYEDLMSAIEHHDEKSTTAYPLFTVLVQFADKMDFTKKRLEPDYFEKFGHIVYENFLDVKFINDDSSFGINVAANDIANIASEFVAMSFSSKVINVVKVLALKLNKQPVIKINDEELPLNNYIIVHGSFGSPDGNWFPWLKEELNKRKLKVDTPQMPVGVGNQNYENWASEFKKQFIDNDTTIIAHSIAPAFVCKFLTTNKIKVKKLIFVCGFNNYLGINEEYDSVNKPMFLDNLAGVKNYCDDIVCYYSDNDPYVNYEAEKSFADTIANKQFVIKDGGHLNAESGYTKFKEILKEI